MPRLQLADLAGQIAGILDVFAIDRQNGIAKGLTPASPRRAVVEQTIDQRTAGFYQGQGLRQHHR
jgi:hypothetical protein